MSTASDQYPPRLRSEGLYCPSGIVVIPEWISTIEEDELVRIIGLSDPIGGDDRNRVERYGPGVLASHYSSGTVFADVPPHLSALCERLVDRRLVELTPNAVSVNEYQVGQGIGFHTDHAASGEVITILSILGDVDMRLRRGKRNHEVVIRFPRRALLQMGSESRYPPWRHGILPVATPRISIVFRYADPNTPGPYV